MKQVLVGTLHCGEHEYDRCVKALTQQRGVSFDHFTLAGLPNKEAHDTLYRRFMESAAGYSYFLKLDADMVFRDSRGLAVMVKEISDSSAAHLFMDVFDWPSQMPIPGIQMFRNDSEWRSSDERLNVDYGPGLRGPSRRDFANVLVDHMPAPSAFQMFRYGVHKALKAIQPDRRDKSMAKGLIHAAILAGIARHWRAAGEERLVLGLIGAMLVLRGTLREILGDYAGSPTRAAFDRLQSDSGLRAILMREAEAFWHNEIQFFLAWNEAMPKAYWL